jgi:hypothetical protein
MANPLDELVDQTKTFFYPEPTPVSYGALVRRRKIAEAIASRRQREFPKTIGEGLTVLGEAIGERRMSDRLDADEQVQAEKEDKIRGTAPSESYLPAAGAAADAGYRVPGAAQRPVNTQDTVMQEAKPQPQPTRAPPSAPRFGPGGLDADMLLREGLNRGDPVPLPLGSVPPYQPPVGGARSQLTPEQIQTVAAASQPRAAAQLSPEQTDEIAGANPLRDRLAAIDLARQGVVPLDPMPAQVVAPGPTIPTASTDEGDPRAAMAQAPYANPITDTDIKPAPDLLPSQQPIPLNIPQEMKHPGPSPTPPPQLGPSNAMRHWSKYIDNPNVSKELSDHAKRQFLLGDEYRKETQTRQFEAYKDQRERWQKKSDDYDDFIRKLPDQNIDRIIKLQGIEKTNADLEEAYYKAGLPREQAAEQARLKILESQRKVNAPATFMARGTQFEQPYDQRTGTLGPARVTPGAPEPEVKEPTEGQAGAIQFVLRTQRDLDAADTGMNYGKALTDRKEASINALLPRGVANAMLSDNYKNARDAYGNFMAAMLNRVSGASVTQSEDLRNSPAFIPEAGDSDERLRVKAQRRRDMIEAVKAGGGTITYDAVKRIMETQKSTEPQSAITEGRTRTNRRTGEQQMYRDGTWVPVR